MTPAQAVPTYAVDTLLGSALWGNSGDAQELAFIRQVTGNNSLTLDFKIDVAANTLGATDNDSVVANVQASNSWYINVTPETPGYFVLRFGDGGITVTADHFAFLNLADLTKLVFTNAQVNGISGATTCNNCNIGRLSHYARFIPDGVTPPTGSAPEPGVLFLMGAGLLGLGMARCRQSA